MNGRAKLRGWWTGSSATGLAIALAWMPTAAAQTAPSSSTTAPPDQSAPGQSLPSGSANLPGPGTQSQVQAGDATPGSTTAAGQVQATGSEAPAPGVSDATGAEVVVTGTNLNSGFRAPTPVTVTTAEQLVQASPNNLADGLTKLPVFNGSISTNSPGSNATAGNVGQNLLNLRNLGDNRNLVLLDGRRVVSTNTDFAVDINTLPQNLVSRVDVVTGGASAAYGSDAVAGVVNFVLDTKFVGVKGELTGGTSTYGDLPSGKISLAVGAAFLHDRLHVVASTETFVRDGLSVTASNPRTWYTRPAGLIPNALGSTPANLVVPDIRSSNGSAGGLITSGALKGTNFLAAGTTAPFNYGYDASSTFQSGGDGYTPNFGFTPNQKRNNDFVHATFDLSDDVAVYAEGGYSYSHTLFYNNVQPFTTASYQFTIYNTNPYIPQSVQTALTAARATSFTLGRYLTDFPEFNIQTDSRVARGAFGFKGKNLFNHPGWNWDVSYSKGVTHQYLAENNVANLRRIYAATDAVTNPATGQIVCRSQYYTGNTFVPGGTGLDPGCRPINVLGRNTVDPAAIAWINGTSYKRLTLHQDVVTAKLAGDLGNGFQLGAGPVSFAAGFEYRRDTASQTADAVSAGLIDFTGIRGGPAGIAGKAGGWRFFNPLGFSGAQDVKEGFLEIGLPVLKDLPFARSLNLDGAVRYTDYSLAGPVTTWKGGLDYEPLDGIRFRGTVSRDVRAPNLLELFNSASQNSQNVLYPSSTGGGTTTPSITITTGNPGLKPEKAITQTYGVVLSPRFLPGVHFSVDYYDIKLKGAIGTLTAQNVIDFCAAGQTTYCSLFTVNSGVVRVNITPLNLNVLEVEGLDFELSYRTPVLGHPLGLRFLANHQMSNYSQAPNATPLLVIGSAPAPRWKAQFQADYQINDLSLFANERFISAVFMDPNRVEGVYTNDNHVPAVFYTDVTLSYRLAALGLKNELFVTVENLFNRAPPIDVIPPTSTSSPTNAAYDRIGRYITAGVRFRL